MLCDHFYVLEHPPAGGVGGPDLRRDRGSTSLQNPWQSILVASEQAPPGRHRAPRKKGAGGVNRSCCWISWFGALLLGPGPRELEIRAEHTG